MTSPLLFLQDKIKVNYLDDDQIEVTVTLPADFLLHYVRLLDSLAGFLKYTNTRARIAKAQSSSQLRKYQEECKQNIANYHVRIVELYDQFISEGLDRNAAIKQVSTTLRQEKDPWSSPDLVRPALIKAGRPGRIGRPRSKS
jgi:hypothetical protein